MENTSVYWHSQDYFPEFSVRTTFLNFLLEDMELSEFPDLRRKALLSILNEGMHHPLIQTASTSNIFPIYFLNILVVFSH